MPNMKRIAKSFLPFAALVVFLAWLSAWLYQWLSTPAAPEAEPAIVEAVEPGQLMDMRASLRELTKASIEASSPGGVLDSTTDEDPYEGWEGWCEPYDYEANCKTDADCEGIEHPAKRPLRCVQPWWAKGADVHVCAPGYSGKKEQAWRLNRLRGITGEYFDEGDFCEEGVGVGKQHWRCQERWRNAESLAKFLRLVALRETSYRPWKRHRLNPDQSANDRAYVRQAKRYGVEVQLRCADGKKRCKSNMKIVDSITPISPDYNAHYEQQWRWHYGLGWYGQVSALHVATWDPQAPPEVLCREVVATESYLRSMRSNWQKLNSGVHCERGTPNEFVRQIDNPTWLDLHHATAGGSTCPKSGWGKAETSFRKRAERVGLDPDQPVSLDMLGDPIDRATQNEVAQDIEAMLNEKWGESPV